MPAANETLKTEEPMVQREAPNMPPATPGQAVPRAWRWANYLIFAPLVMVATVAFGTISLACGVWDEDGRQQHALARMWARVLLRVALSPVKLEHAERLVRGAAVYASNHLSYYDTPVLYAKCRFSFGFWRRRRCGRCRLLGGICSGRDRCRLTRARRALAW
jgi:1-acyl-sn-glycerol-3-phosphate acyltransferase